MTQDRKALRWLIVICALAVIWLALLVAPYAGDGLVGIINGFGQIMQHPFSIKICEDSLRTVLVLLLVYGLIVGVIISNDRNYRKREEHGSARWGDAAASRGRSPLTARGST